mgnify:CR=1 FL=1
MLVMLDPLCGAVQHLGENNMENISKNMNKIIKNSENDFGCVNCGDDTSTRRKRAALYCSSYCAQFAEKVRYARRKRIEGTIQKPDIANVIKTNIIWLYLGGYQRKPISSEVKLQVKLREIRTRSKIEIRTEKRRENENGLMGVKTKEIETQSLDDTTLVKMIEGGEIIHRCNNCNRRAHTKRLELDHIDGPSGNVNNLQYLCIYCHGEKTTRVLHNLPNEKRHKEPYAEFKSEFYKRVNSPKPTHVCDEEKLWPKLQSKLLAKRRKLMKSL